MWGRRSLNPELFRFIVRISYLGGAGRPPRAEWVREHCHGHSGTFLRLLADNAATHTLYTALPVRISTQKLPVAPFLVQDQLF